MIALSQKCHYRMSAIDNKKGLQIAGLVTCFGLLGSQHVNKLVDWGGF